MNTLKVGHLRRIAGINQGFVAGLNQSRQPAAQNRLLAKKVRFGFILEGSFDHGGPRPADSAGIGQADFLRVTGRILMDS